MHAVGLAPTKGPSGPPDLQSGAFAARHTHAELIGDLRSPISNLPAEDFRSTIICVTKTDEGSENGVTNTLRGTLLLRMANSWTLAKHRVHHPEGSLPSSLANRYFDYQKTKGAGF